MSNKLPAISGDDLVRALGRDGWTKARQNGSHMRLERKGRPPITVPRHRTLKIGTLSSILKQAGLDGDDLRRLL